MLIETDQLDDYCKDTGDCRACVFVDDEGECKYKTFLEEYEYLQRELDDSDYETMRDPQCYFCGKTMKAGNRRYINYEKGRGHYKSTEVCMKCYTKLKKYEKANNLKECDE